LWKKELAIFEVEGERGAHFERFYENLNSMPLGSVEPERVFSGCGRTVTKIRSSLHDECVDMLVLSFIHTEKKIILRECYTSILRGFIIKEIIKEILPLL
jgi:hypothetical protein